MVRSPGLRKYHLSNSSKPLSQVSAHGANTRLAPSLEIALVMICGSVPTLKPLYDYFAHNKPLGPHKRPQASSGKSSYRKHTDNSSDGSRTRRFFGGSTGNSTLVTSSVGDNHPWQASRSDLATASKKINVEQRFDIDLEENISSRGLGDNAGRLV